MLLFTSISPGPARPPTPLRRPDLRHLSAHYTSVAHIDDEPAGHHQVILHDGQVLVDGRRIANPQFQPGQVSWREKTSTHISSGCLHALAEGSRLSGVITFGHDEASAELAFVELAPEPIDFDTELQREDGWRPGPKLTLGVTIDDGLLYATGTLDGETVTASALPPSPDTQGAVIDVAMEPGSDLVNTTTAYPLPFASRIVLSLDGSAFEGTMTPQSGAAPIPWRGKALRAPAALHAMAARTDQAVTALPLSLQDLVSLSTSEAPTIASSTFNQLTMFGMQDDWRDKLFGAAKPALDDEIGQVYASYGSLFAEHVSDAAILRQLADMTSDAGGPSDPISSADQLKLDYFFRAGLQQAAGFNDCSARMTQIAWERSCPRLRDYLQDPTEPSWVQRLFTALTSQRGMTAMTLSYLGTNHDLSQINRTTDLLLALSPKANQPLLDKNGKPTGQLATYATLYHTKVLTSLGLAGVEQINFPDAPADQKEFADYLAVWFETLLTEAGARVKDPNMPAAQKAMYTEIEIEMSAARDLAGGMQNLAVGVTAGISTSVGSTTAPRNLIGKIQNWAATSKLAGAVKKGIKIGAAGYALYSVISAFNNWSSLSDKQKAQSVILTSELPINLLELAADLQVPQVFSKIITYFRTDSAAAAIVERGLLEDVSEDEYFFNPMVRWAAPAMEDAASEGASTFARLFGQESKFLKAFGVAAAAAALGFNCYQIYEDRNESAVTIALDSLQIVAGSMVLVGAVVAMVSAECAFAVLGPIGAVCGVILMIVSLILGKPKPKKPADDYMDKRGNPYLASLKAPPPGWRPPPKIAAPAF